MTYYMTLVPCAEPLMPFDNGPAFGLFYTPFSFPFSIYAHSEDTRYLWTM